MAYWTMVVVLTGFSVFFVLNVEWRRRSWASKKEVSIADGDPVRVVRIIDGDEVSVEASEGRAFVVRLLGIKSFNPTINEPGLSTVGRTCKDALARTVEGKQVRVRFKTFKRDRAKRVLAYLERDGKDIGLTLVKQGHALVYTRYPFSREQRYLAVELEARTRGRGLWANDKARLRATALKATWETQRND